MIRYMDNAFKTLAEETAWPNSYRKLLWCCVGIAIAAFVSWILFVPMQYPIK